MVVNADPGDFHRMRLEPDQKHDVRMQMLGFVNAFTSADLLGDDKGPGIAHDAARAFVRNAINQNPNDQTIQKS